MRRRQFMVLAGASIGLPRFARAQHPGRIARVAVVMGIGDGVDGRARVAAFKKGMNDLNWSEGINIAYDVRWSAGDPTRVKTHVDEIVGQKPDIIFGTTSPVLQTLKSATQTIPIVFAILADPIGDSIVASLSRPGGNITGFSSYEATMGGKWLQLLKDISPGLQRVAVIHHPTIAPIALFWPSLEATAPSLGLSLIRAGVMDPRAFEATIAAQAGMPGAGLLMPPDAFTSTHRKIIYALSEQHRLPAIWPDPSHAAGGGLMCYGPDFADLCLRAAAYVDRILRGASAPADLPVQQPTKYELSINLKTAKAIGLDVPVTLLATADEVIE